MPLKNLKLTPSQFMIKIIGENRNLLESMTLTLKYLDGVPTNTLDSFIISYLTQGSNSNNTQGILDFYKKKHIDFDSKRINEDPTRRYFETHLCYETLIRSLNHLSLEDLKSLYDSAIDLGGENVRKAHQETLNNGEYLAIATNGAIGRSSEKIQTNNMLEKTKLLCKLGAYATDLAKNSDILPYDIYGSSPLYKNNYRARDPREDFYYKKEPNNMVFKTKIKYTDRNLGVMRAEMPLPKNDIAINAQQRGYQRPTDNSNPLINDDDNWPNKIFSLNVLPYANSPSGTMLCQLRLLILLKRKNLLPQGIDYNNYLKCFISAMLYGSGGHTLYEFVVPLTMSLEDLDLQYELQQILRNKINNVSDLFFSDDPKPCLMAMANTIIYNAKYCNLLKRIPINKIQKILDEKRSENAAAKAAYEQKRMEEIEEKKKSLAKRVLEFNIHIGITNIEALLLKSKNQKVLQAKQKNYLDTLEKIKKLGIDDYPVAKHGETKALYAKRLASFFIDKDQKYMKTLPNIMITKGALEYCIHNP